MVYGAGSLRASWFTGAMGLGSSPTRSVRWWWVSVPLLAGGLAYLVLRLAVTDLAILGRVKSSMEVAALAMTCAAVLVTLVGFIVRRRAFTAWLLVLASL